MESNITAPTDLTRPLTPAEIELVKARTRQIETMTEDQHQFNVVTLQKAIDEARIAEIERIKAERSELISKADDLNSRYYIFDHEVSSKSVQACLARLNYWHRNFPNEDITIVFNSPGGSITDGFALFDRITQLRDQGHTVYTEALGTAASMAAILLQAGTVRRMGKETWLLVHEGGIGVQGTSGAVKDTTDWYDRLKARLANIIVERAQAAGDAGTAAHPLTLRTLKQKWDRKDWWISSDEALDMGLVDEVV